MGLHCHLVTSWPVDTGIGSGVAESAFAIRRACKESGIDASIKFPSFPSSGYLYTSFKRVIFDLGLRGDPSLSDGSPVITFDFDGFALKRNSRYAAVNGGILADIVRFETGAVRQSLKIMAMLEKRANNRAERVFAPSRYAKGKIEELYGVPGKKINILHSGIFFNEWLGMTASARIEKNRPPTVLCVARLYRRKGVERLIREWPLVLSELRGAVLRVVGDGLEKRKLERLVEKMGIGGSVKFYGDITSRNTLAEYYSNCDVFCLPSMHETFGLVFLEAMAAGKPIVAMNVTAVPEVVRDGLDGFLVEPSDMGGLADRIVLLLKNEELREKMGQSGMSRARESFDWKNTIKPLVEWIKGGGS